MNRYPKYKFLFAANDIVMIFISFLFSAMLTSKIKSYTLPEIIFNYPYIIFVFLFFALLSVIIFQSNNLYKINIFLTVAAQTTAIIRSLFFGGIFIIVLTFIIKFNVLFDSRLFIVILIISSFVLLILSRVILLRKAYSLLSKNKIIRRNIVIIGAGQTGKLLATKLFVEDSLGINIIGFVDDNIPKGRVIIGDVMVLGNINELPKISSSYKLDEFIIAIDHISYERMLEILDFCYYANFSVKVISELFSVIPDKLETEKYSNIPLINLMPQLPNSILLFFKTMIDSIGASLSLILLSPLFIVLALLIKLSSKGPVFYTHVRIGKNGKPFKFYKFRSMYSSCEEDNSRKEAMINFMKMDKKQGGNHSKIINESRVTGIGKFIRKYSLDELPQLINVIKGDMSLVGPRPCLPYEYEHYDEWQKRRHAVLPGCTGVWQVYGRSAVSFNDSIILDLYYVNNVSPWLDLQLIIKTIPVVLFSRGGK